MPMNKAYRFFKLLLSIFNSLLCLCNFFFLCIYSIKCFLFCIFTFL